MTKKQKCDNIKVTNTERSIKKSKKTHGQAPRIINMQCRTMYTTRLQLRHNKNTTSARPARGLAFLSGAWTAKEMAFSRNPTGRSEQSDAQGLRRSPLTEATNTKTTGAAQGEKQNETQSTHGTHHRRHRNRDPNRGRNRQRLPIAEDSRARGLQLDHNSRRKERLQIRKDHQ